MSLQRVLLMVSSIVVLSALLPATAAAVEIGSRCTASGGDQGTRVQTTVAPGGPVYSAPTAGIVTKWGLSVPAEQSGTVRLKIVSYDGGTAAWTVLGQSDAMQAVGGLNMFDTRIPVAAGNTIALYSPTYAAYCLSGVPPGDTTSVPIYGSDVQLGEVFTPDTSKYGSHLALFAVIEPDADGDGFGDESQDLCPQRADMQIACPAVSIASLKRKAGKKRLKLTLATNTQTTVKLTASARIPASGGKRAKTIRFKMLTKASNPAGSTIFTLKYPSKLRSALNSLPRRSKIKLTLKFSATGLIDTATKTYRVSLRGRG